MRNWLNKKIDWLMLSLGIMLAIGSIGIGVLIVALWWEYFKKGGSFAVTLGITLGLLYAVYDFWRPPADL